MNTEFRWTRFPVAITRRIQEGTDLVDDSASARPNHFPGGEIIHSDPRDLAGCVRFTPSTSKRCHHVQTTTQVGSMVRAAKHPPVHFVRRRRTPKIGQNRRRKPLEKLVRFSSTQRGADVQLPLPKERTCFHAFRRMDHARVDRDLPAGPMAHELAYMYLGHEILSVRSEDDRRQEDEANSLVKEWSFDGRTTAFSVS